MAKVSIYWEWGVPRRKPKPYRKRFALPLVKHTRTKCHTHYSPFLAHNFNFLSTMRTECQTNCQIYVNRLPPAFQVISLSIQMIYGRLFQFEILWGKRIHQFCNRMHAVNILDIPLHSLVVVVVVDVFSIRTTLFTCWFGIHTPSQILTALLLLCS